MAKLLTGCDVYDTEFPSYVDHATTSTMQRHIVQAHDGTLGAIIQRGEGEGELQASARGLVFIRSVDGGKTWTFSNQLIDAYLYTASIQKDEESNLYVTYGRITNPDDLGGSATYTIYFRKFTYSSVTKIWTMGTAYTVFTASGANSTASWVNICREKVSGRLWICWRHYQDSTNLCSIKIVYSDDEGQNWTNTGLSIGFANASPGRYGVLIATSTFIMLTFHDTDNAAVEYKRSTKHLIGDPPTTWEAVVTITTVTSGAAGTHFVAMADRDDAVHMTIEDPEPIVEQNYTKYAIYRNGVWSTPEIVGFGESHYPSICYDRVNNIMHGFANTLVRRAIGYRGLDVTTGLWSDLQTFHFETQFVKVNLNAGSVVVDRTSEAWVAAADFWHPDTGKMLQSVGDYIECFSLDKIDYIAWQMAIPGVTGVVSWQYWNGASYVALSITESSSPSFGATMGYITFTPPTDWVRKVVGGQTPNLYAIKAIVTTAYTTSPIGDYLMSYRKRQRLAIPAEVDIIKSGYTIPSIQREGEASQPDGSLWVMESLIFELPIFYDQFRLSGKGLDSNKDIIYLLDINLGGTMGTYTYASKSCDVEGTFYKAKLQSAGVVRKSMEIETGQFETSDISISLSNADLEFSKYPWHNTILNKRALLKMGFLGNKTHQYRSDTILNKPFSGRPGDVSTGITYTLYKGIVKTEERSGKEFRLSIGDYTNKIFRTIPPRIIKVTEFPNVGTSVMVLGTKTDFDTDLVGKPIPYIYGDFSSNANIQPLFIDTVKRRYLIADHAIGTISSVFSNGTQVYNFTHPNINGLVGGTHIGTHVMSFIDFGTSQGTKSVYVSITGRYDTYGSMIKNPVLILKDMLLSQNICDLSQSDIGTVSFDTTEGWLSPYNYRYIMDGKLHTNSIDFIQDLSVCSLSNFYFDKDNLASFDTYRPAVSRTNIKKAGQTEILEDSFSIQRDVRNMYNKVLINYDYDWFKEEYRNVYEIGGTTYISRFDTVKTFTLDAPFVHNSNEAAYISRKLLSRLQNGLNKATFSIPLAKLPIDIADKIQVTHEEGFTLGTSWIDRLINITECEIDNRNKTINIFGVDENELNVDNKYFILGNGTAFYSSASSAQRYYGALCSAGGTMSNGDIGYILW